MFAKADAADAVSAFCVMSNNHGRRVRYDKSDML